MEERREENEKKKKNTGRGITGRKKQGDVYKVEARKST